MRLALPTLLLVFACSPLPGLPSGARLPPVADPGDVVGFTFREVRTFVDVTTFTHPTNPDLLLLYVTQYDASGHAVLVADARRKEVFGACLDDGGSFPHPLVTRTAGGVGHWDWDDTSLHVYAVGDFVQHCSPVTGEAPADSAAVHAFPETLALTDGGLVTWDQNRDTLVDVKLNPYSLEPFGDLPDPLLVVMRADDAGLWTVSRDADANTLLLYEVDAKTHAIDLRLTVPIGGTFDGVVFLDDGVLAWRTDEGDHFVAGYKAGGTVRPIAVGRAPYGLEAWFDGKGVTYGIPSTSSLNLVNGRVHTAGVALRNGLHATVEPLAADTLQLTWSDNNPATGDALTAGTQTLDVAISPGLETGTPRELVAVAYAHGACVVGRLGDQTTVTNRPDPWKEDVITWATQGTSLFSGPCGGTLAPLASGIEASPHAVLPGAILRAGAAMTKRDENAWLPLAVQWALDPQGRPSPIHAGALHATTPGRAGIAWSVRTDGNVKRYDASRLFAGPGP